MLAFIFNIISTAALGYVLVALYWRRTPKYTPGTAVVWKYLDGSGSPNLGFYLQRHGQYHKVVVMFAPNGWCDPGYIATVRSDCFLGASEAPQLFPFEGSSQE